MLYGEFLSQLGLTKTPKNCDNKVISFFKECIVALKNVSQLGEVNENFLDQVETNAGEEIRNLVIWLREEGLDAMYRVSEKSSDDSKVVEEQIKRYRHLLYAGVTDASYYKDIYSFCMAYMDVVYGMESLLTDQVNES